MQLPEIQSQILWEYVSTQGERRSGAPACTHKRFVNAMNTKQVHFQDDEELQDGEEME